MLTLFISYHKNDEAVLAQLLDWLEPFRHKYFLRIWYNRYDRRDEANRLEYTDELHNAQIYLFLTSQQWLADRKIQKEVEVALDRRHRLGANRIFLFPVQVRPCLWRNFSKLVEVEDFALPAPQKELLKFDPRDTGFHLITEKLERTVPGLRQLLIEEATLQGASTHGFFTLASTPKERAPRKGRLYFTLDEFKRWVVIAALLFLIFSIYQIGCQDQPFKNEVLKSIHRAR